MTKKTLGRIQSTKKAPVQGLEERRRDTRVPITQTVKLKVGSAAEAVTGDTINISKNGMFISMTPVPPVGTMLDIELALPDRRLLFHATGKVVRSHADREPQGAGVQFVSISYESSELIDEMLAAAKRAEE